MDQAVEWIAEGKRAIGSTRSADLKNAGIWVVCPVTPAPRFGRRRDHLAHRRALLRQLGELSSAKTRFSLARNLQ
jgi:hypothetical protein